MTTTSIHISQRFRNYLPVVVDVETGGFDPQQHGLLEVAAIILKLNEQGLLVVETTLHQQVLPFEGAQLDPSALEFNQIRPYHPLRQAVPEKQALSLIFQAIRQAIKTSQCNRAILVGHNATFDLSFINAAANRSHIKRNPFHPFSCFDTVTLAGLACGQTVLAKACSALGIAFDSEQAHSALYDAERTAELFCTIVNRWQQLGGWQWPSTNDVS
jgi:ribonuclease T